MKCNLCTYKASRWYENKKRSRRQIENNEYEHERIDLALIPLIKLFD